MMLEIKEPTSGERPRKATRYFLPSDGQEVTTPGAGAPGVIFYLLINTGLFY